MTNRQTQRDAQRQRRREEKAKARREIRQIRAPAPGPARASARVAPPPPPPRKRPWAWIVVGSIIGVLAIVGIGYALKENNQPLPGVVYASQGNQHINPGDTHPAYNSNPPTSGWHFPTWPQRGIYTEDLPEEWLLHFQEHAGVVVHYNPKKLPAAQIAQLTAISKSELNKGQGLVLQAPDPNIPMPIALTAWQHMETFNTVTGNTSKIQDFIERLQCNYDPEGVCGPPHGNQFYPTGTPAAGQATVVAPTLPANAPSATVAPNQRLETNTPIGGAPASTGTPAVSATPAASATTKPATATATP